jgi:hypothetical protein
MEATEFQKWIAEYYQVRGWSDLDIKRLLLSPGNTSILPENIVGQSLSVGFRPLPQTTPCGR